jgi:hypothetical protein
MKRHMLVSGVRFQRSSWVALAVVLNVIIFPTIAWGGNILTIEQYEEIADPLFDTSILSMSIMTTGQAFVPLLHAWQLNNRTFLQSYDDKVRDATAVAMTTHAIKNLKIRLHPVKVRSFMLIDKLKKDLSIYEEEYPEVKGGLFGSALNDEKKVEAEKNYTAIKEALKRYEYPPKTEKIDGVDEKENEGKKKEKWVLIDAEETLRKDTILVHGDPKDPKKPGAIKRVLQRLTLAKKGLSVVDHTAKYLAEPLAKLGKTQYKVERMVMGLSRGEGARSPKKQLLITMRNFAEDLNFLIQIQTKDKGDIYRPRWDFFYPQMLPRRRSPETKSTKYWVPVDPGDKLVIRALTMNKHRREILYRPIDRYKVVEDGKVTYKWYNYVRPEMNSWTRNPYVLGYEARRGVKSLVTRMYSTEERYNWTFNGGWSQTPELKNSDGRTLRDFSIPLILTNDRMEWVIPEASAKAVIRDGGKMVMTTEVTGEAKITITHKGPNTKNPERVVDQGSGRLEITLQPW